MGAISFAVSGLEEGEPHPFVHRFGQRLVVQFEQLGFRVEQIELTRSPRHEDEDAGLRRPVKVRGSRCERIDDIQWLPCGRGRCRRREGTVGGEHIGESDRPQSTGGREQEVPASLLQVIGEHEDK